MKAAEPLWHLWWSAAGAMLCPNFFGFVWYLWSAAAAVLCPRFFGFVWHSWWSTAGARIFSSLVGFSPTVYHSKLNWHRPQEYDNPNPAHAWSQTNLRFLRATYELPKAQRVFTTSSANVFSSLLVYCVEIFLMKPELPRRCMLVLYQCLWLRYGFNVTLMNGELGDRHWNLTTKFTAFFFNSTYNAFNLRAKSVHGNRNLFSQPPANSSCLKCAWSGRRRAISNDFLLDRNRVAWFSWNVAVKVHLILCNILPWNRGHGLF